MQRKKLYIYLGVVPLKSTRHVPRWAGLLIAHWHLSLACRFSTLWNHLHWNSRVHSLSISNVSNRISIIEIDIVEPQAAVYLYTRSNPIELIIGLMWSPQTLSVDDDRRNYRYSEHLICWTLHRPRKVPGIGKCNDKSAYWASLSSQRDTGADPLVMGPGASPWSWMLVRF